MAQGLRLLGDVGGTNARFALQAGPGAPVGDPATLPSADHPSLLAAIRAFLARHGSPRIAEAAIGIANPVTGDHVAMTNHDWSFSISGLKAALGVERLLLLNDFSALALALPALRPGQWRPVGPLIEPVADAPIGLIGPGTGLGVGGLMPDGRGGWRPLAGEGGHVTLAGANGREDAVLAALRARFGHASAERAVSGQGLENLHAALATVDGAAVEDLAAAEIARRASDGSDGRCVEALALFFAFLGSAAGNLALTLGARGGIVIGGGIVPRLGDAIDRSGFRERFEAKGRFAGYLRAIPTRLIVTDYPVALLGAAAALDA